MQTLRTICVEAMQICVKAMQHISKRYAIYM
jgi:hypothetical protein